MLLTFISGFILPVTFEASAQDTESTATHNTKYVRLLLQNGGVYEGEVLEIDESSFLINTFQLGHMRIAKTAISSNTYISADQVGLLKISNRSGDLNPQPRRYYLAPSAMPLKKGEGYYQNGWLIYNQVSYGVTDNIALSIIPQPLGIVGIVQFGCKVADKLHVSAGGIVVIPFLHSNFRSDRNGGDTWVIPFTNVTIGDEQKNLTLSYGVVFGKPRNTSRYSTQIFNFSAMIEISSSMWLMTENFFMVIDHPAGPSHLISMGLRKASKKRDMVWDYCLVGLPADDIYGIPWISCTIPF